MLSTAERERAIGGDVRQRAGEVLRAIRALAILDEVAALNRRMLDLLQARVTEGASPPLERDLVDVEVRRIEAERAMASADLDAVLVQLKALVGLQLDAPLLFGQDLEQVVLNDGPPTGAPGAAQEAIHSRPDVREADARVKFAEARIDQMRREGRLDIAVFGSYMRMDAGFPQRAFNEAGQLTPIGGIFHNAAVGASIEVPLLNRNEGAVVAAEAERRAAEQMRRSKELYARAELAAATVRDRQAWEAVTVFTSGARELARQNLEVVRQSFELGRTPLFDVLAEQRRYLDIENAYTDVLYAAYQARADLRRATGAIR
jgi:cobalt-zinc-cadmium efflux system outer membrane protein